MPKKPLKNLVIRTAAVRIPEVGYIIACDPRKEENEVQHAHLFRWAEGEFNRGEAKFAAHTECVIREPEPAILMASGDGIYSVESRAGVTVGNVFRDSRPQPTRRKYGGIRSVSEIAGEGYAAGFEGSVYRLEKPNLWRRIDEGLPLSFDIEAVHGFGASELYAVGFKGMVWQYNGHKWLRRHVPTNETLNAVRCAGDDVVYIGGRGGLLLRGRGDKWSVIKQTVIEDDIWSLAWFEDELYISTQNGVFRLEKGTPREIDFGKDIPETTYQLSAAPGVLWSIGATDIMAFDGERWTRIV